MQIKCEKCSAVSESIMLETYLERDMLTRILWNSISYFDYGEEYYHGMLNGIFASRGYAPDSNDEAGLGRLDLRILDRGNRRLLLLEFKRSEREADLDRDCDLTISQIFQKGYDRAMPEGYEQQMIYGIAFYAKSAKVKAAQKTEKARHH